MKDLIRVFNKQAVTSSLQIAEHFGKRHDSVIRAIRKAERTQATFGLSEKPFHRATYKEGGAL